MLVGGLRVCVCVCVCVYVIYTCRIRVSRVGKEAGCI